MTHAKNYIFIIRFLKQHTTEMNGSTLHPSRYFLQGCAGWAERVLYLLQWEHRGEVLFTNWRESFISATLFLNDDRLVFGICFRSKNWILHHNPCLNTHWTICCNGKYYMYFWKISENFLKILASSILGKDCKECFCRLIMKLFS